MAVVAFEILKPILKSARDKGVKLSGQMAVEHEKCGKFPLVFFCKPDGDHVVWFIEDGMHKLYSLVNENEKHICDYPSHMQEEFQQKLREIQQSLGE